MCLNEHMSCVRVFIEAGKGRLIPWTGVTGGYKLLDVGAEKQAPE